MKQNLKIKVVPKRAIEIMIKPPTLVARGTNSNFLTPSRNPFMTQTILDTSVRKSFRAATISWNESQAG